MVARIITYRTQDKYMTVLRDYSNELDAQEAFDELTPNASEFNGYLQWDLEVKHPEMGWIIRRTVFTDK